MTRVAALIVSYRSSDELPPLVATLDAARGDVDVDVFVIENSTEDAEVEKLRAVDGIAKVVQADHNLGYGAGMNALAAALEDGYDWFLICNPDIRFSPGSIAALVGATGPLPHSALFGPLIRTAENAVYPSARAFPSLRTGVGHATLGRIWRGNPWTRRYHGRTDGGTEPREVDWLSGACLLVRPEAFRLVGGFDEDFFMYFEDVDLAYRLKKAGWDATYVPQAEITHSGAHSTSTAAGRMRKAHHESARRYLDKKYSAWWLAPLRLVVRVGLAIRMRITR